MRFSSPRSCWTAVLLLLAVGAFRAFAGPDSVTSFDNRPASSSSSTTRSPPGASSKRGISSSTVAGTNPSSSGSGSNTVTSCNSKNIIQRGNLSVAEPWSEAAPLTLDFVPLPKGRCVGWTLTADALAGTACAEKSPENYILVEFWQLGSNSTITAGGSIGGPGSGRSNLPKVPYGGPVIDVKVLAARGTKPSLTWGPEDMIKVVPPIRDPTTGLTPVGSFQDDAGVVYNRPALRIMFPTDSPVTDVGEPADPNSWYVTIANMPDQQALPAYALRASCVNINPQPKAPIGTFAANRSSSSTAAKKEAGLPCPVPSPGGKQCNGHGTCRTDTSDLSPEYSRYCACDAGWGSWGCQLQLLSLPLNAREPVTAIIPPGKWGYWEVTLPPWAGPLQGSGDVSATAAARGGGSSSGNNEQLLLMAERVPVPGMGGNPLLFLKPFQNKDHNEPALDGISFDIVNYADLRSFQLQLNRQFINYRLPLRESRGVGPGNRGLTRPRRWYVAIYNSNASRLSEPARVKLWVEYRDLTRQSVACPFDCNGRGRCVDPLTPLQTMRGSMPQGLPRLTDSKTAGMASGQNPELASLMALGPLQDLSPVDAGFMCSCSQGFGGLLCEGRVQNLTIGSGEQKTGPEVLEPGAWFYYVVTVDSKFNPNSDNLGIQWIVGQPSSPPNNYSNAYISFDQGPLHRQQQLMGMQRQQVRRGMTPYSKLIVRSNPPLPLEVPGGQLSPGATYVVSIFNNDYVVSMPFMYSLAFYVMGEGGSYLHPYMSILLGVTAAVILCLVMTLCKRVVVRYGFVPWRWRQRQRQLQAAAAAGGRDSLALVLMAQTQPASRGVPAEIYQAFPSRPYAVKDFQKRQHGLQHGAAATTAAAEDAADAGDDTIRQDQGARRSPSAAAAAHTAGVDTDAVHSPQSAVVSPASQQQQPRWPLVGLHWSSSAAPAAATAASAAAAAAAAAPKDDDAAPAAADTAKADAVASKSAAAAADRDDDIPSCAVCLCEYASGELVRELPCHHEFHQSCIDQWMVSHGTCPICRAPLWAGALADEAAADGSGDGRTDGPAAIFVHHDMPPGGLGGQDAAGSTAADREWVRMLRHWRERNRQEQRLRRQLRRLQQQEEELQQQQQQQRRDEEDAPPSAAATVAAAAAAAERPHTLPAAAGTWQEMAVVGSRQQQQPEVLSSPQQQQQASAPTPASAMPAAAGDIEQQMPPAATPGGAAPPAAAAGAGAGAAAPADADERIMGTFTLGRRRSSQQQH